MVLVSVRSKPWEDSPSLLPCNRNSFLFQFFTSFYERLYEVSGWRINIVATCRWIHIYLCRIREMVHLVCSDGRHDTLHDQPHQVSLDCGTSRWHRSDPWFFDPLGGRRIGHYHGWIALLCVHDVLEWILHRNAGNRNGL